MLLPLLAFVFGLMLVGAGALLLMPKRAVAIDRRIEELTSGVRDRDAEEPQAMKSFLGLVKRIGEKAPRSPKEMGQLRLRLVQAGYRREEALTMFFGIRVFLALALFGLFSTPIIMPPNIPLALGGLGVGYVLPGMLLARMAKRRAPRICTSETPGMVCRRSRITRSSTSVISIAECCSL